MDLTAIVCLIGVCARFQWVGPGGVLRRQTAFIPVNPLPGKGVTRLTRDLLFDPYHAANHRDANAPPKYCSIKVPRVAPPASKLISIIQELEADLGVSLLEDGLVGVRSVDVVFQEMAMKD
eukprot:2764420-Prymnesium_polylepis.2